MSAIDNIRHLAQKTYYTINNAINDDTGEDLEAFEDEFIIAFNLWIDEYEAETYWNSVRENDFELTTITNTEDFAFELPEAYRTPVINENQQLKLVLEDGTVIAKFNWANPNQRVVDDASSRPNRATFIDDNKIVLSRKPKEEEVGARIVFDVVRHFPKLTREDDTAINLVAGKSKQVAVLGIAKNTTLADVTKVSLSPSFAQKYANELNKLININNASNEMDEVRGDNYGYIGGIW